MENLEKIIHPCDCPIYNGKKYPIFCTISYKEGKLSISGVHGPLPSGNARGGCGQIDMKFAHKNPQHNDKRTAKPITPAMLRFTPGWDSKTWLEFLEVWHLWHLNDLKAGCEHQRALGWEEEGYNKHPSEACPVCSYKFGTAWNTIEIPQTVLNFLKTLPETNRTPAWC